MLVSLLFTSVAAAAPARADGGYYATGISAWAIAAANGIYNMNRIYAGQSLWIPCP